MRKSRLRIRAGGFAFGKGKEPMDEMKLELHAHTAEVSSCGRMPAAELMERYARAGYGALVVTDHLWNHWGGSQPVSERVECYLTGYRLAQEAGTRLGVKVLLGAELRVEPAKEDYLAFGLTEELLPELMAYLDAEPAISALHEYLRARRVLLVQAHPFRPGLRAMPGDWLDGVEVYNGNPRHDSHNAEALAYGRQVGKVLASGSDAHQAEDVARGGIYAPRWVEDAPGLFRFLSEQPAPRRIEDGR